MLRRTVGLLIAAPAVALRWFAAISNRAWFERHVVVPAYRLPPPAWTLPALRIAAIALDRGRPRSAMGRDFRGEARPGAAPAGRQCRGRRLRQRSGSPARGRRAAAFRPSRRRGDARAAGPAPPQRPG